MSLSTHITYWFISVKWLGKDTLTPLAVDGKGGKAELLEKVARWVVARGRNVTQPGTQRCLALFSRINCFFRK
jgi:hypothetical protein